VNADTHQHCTTSGQESAAGQRQEAAMPPARCARRGGWRRGSCRGDADSGFWSW